MNSIEAYIQFEEGLISEDGSVSDRSTKEFLQNYMSEFHSFIARVYTVLPRNTWRCLAMVALSTRRASFDCTRTVQC